MLKLFLHNPQAVGEDLLVQMMHDNLSVLERAQKGEERYRDSQDWLDTDVCAGEDVLARIENKAREIRENADAFVLIGVGGSNNAARSAIKALEPGGTEIIYAGNTLNPHALTKMLDSLDGKDFYIDCIAKNFETLEPGSSFRILRAYMDKKYGDKAAKRIIATGTAGSTLDALCRKEGYDFFEFPLNIGGRYTAMSNVGLLPMAVSGIDIREVVHGAHDMQTALHTGDPMDNPAYRYACIRNVLYGKGYRLEMLSSFEPRFRYFYHWWEQLFAESEGKENKGIFPVTGEFSEELHSIGQFVQDGSPILFETFLDVADRADALVIRPDRYADYFDYLDNVDFYDINRAAYQATVKAHSEKLPVMTLELGALDAYHFGQLFYFFQFACYLSCAVMGVNPFDQPGVEAYKKWMFDALGK